jgi:hypothetical protein
MRASNSGVASWTFASLAPGSYRLALTWGRVAGASSDARFTVFDGARKLGVISVNQQQPPGDFQIDKTWWEHLGGHVAISSGRLTVKLSASRAGGLLLADAIRLEAVDPASVRLVAAPRMVPGAQVRVSNLAMNRRGDAVAVLVQEGAGAESTFIQRLDHLGRLRGEAIQVPYVIASLAVGGDGSFVVMRVAWDGIGGSAAWAQRYNADGTPSGAAFRLNQRSYDLRSPVLAMDATGRFMAAWSTGTQVIARRFAANGRPLGPEFIVNSTGGDSVAIGMNPAGQFVIAWDQWIGPNRQVVAARRFDAAWQPLGEPFIVKSRLGRTFDRRSLPAVAVDDAGGFVIAWDQRHQYWLDAHPIVGAQKYDSLGRPAGPARRIGFDEGHPLLAVDGGGRFMIVTRQLMLEYRGMDPLGWVSVAQRVSWYNNALAPLKRPAGLILGPDDAVNVDAWGSILAVVTER